MDLGLRRALTGFASGIMVSASVWSLIIPSIDYSSNLGKLSFLPASIGFMIGILFLLILDNIIPHLHFNSSSAWGAKKQTKENNYACISCYTAQHSWRNGRWYCIMPVNFSRLKMQNYFKWCLSSFYWYSYTKYTWRCNHIYAFKIRGYGQRKVFLIRCTFRNCWTYRCYYYNFWLWL